MLVRWKSVVIAVGRKNGEIFALESLLYHISDSYCVVNNLRHRIIPIVVGGVVASPEHHVRINFIRDILHHVLDQFRDCVAGACTPLTSSSLARTRHAELSPAAEVAATLD